MSLTHPAILISLGLISAALLYAAVVGTAKPEVLVETRQAIAALGMELPKLRHPTANHWVSGQPTLEQLSQLKARGITRVINLRPAAEAPELKEAEHLHAIGLSYRELPITGDADLTLANAQKLDALLAESGEDSTLLHCASGNRVGALMSLRAAWIQQKPPTEALRIGRDYGMTSLAPVVQKLLALPAVPAS